jgi:hypothetical protein
MNNKKRKKRLKTEPPFDPEIPLLGIYPKQMKSVGQKAALLCLLQHYLQYQRNGNNYSVHQLINGSYIHIHTHTYMCIYIYIYIYIHNAIYTAIERNAIPAIVDAVNGSGEHQTLKVVRW